MSGAVKSNVFGSSGTVAAAAGGLSWQDVVTASTVTVESNKGYFINTTSNACTVTLPASPDVGDQVILLDYARTWDTNAITIDSNGNDFQNQSDDYIVDYDTEGQGINIVFSGSTNGWIPNSDIANALTPVAPTPQRAAFAFGQIGGNANNIKNLVGSNGVVASDATGVGGVSGALAATSYGGDKGVFAYGVGGGSQLNKSNLLNNSGVISADVTGVGTVRNLLAAAPFGGDKGVFYGGSDGQQSYNHRNLVDNQGAIAADATGAGTARYVLAGCGYGGDKGIFSFGDSHKTNLVSNTGVVSADITGTGTNRIAITATSYNGGQLGIFLFGSSTLSITNLVNSSGVIAADTSGVSGVTGRRMPSATPYGGDKAITAFGTTGSVTNISNLISNTGVVSADTTGVGTAREQVAASSYSYSA